MPDHGPVIPEWRPRSPKRAAQIHGSHCSCLDELKEAASASTQLFWFNLQLDKISINVVGIPGQQFVGFTSRFEKTIPFIMKLLSVVILAVGIPPSYAAERYKFRSWLPYYDYHWQQRAEICAPEIHRYHTDNRTGLPRGAVCAAAVDCLLTNVTQSIQSNLASADILLGLTPTILSFAGPSRGELAILSTHSPLFAGILSFGFPSMFITNLFGSVDVNETLRKPVARIARGYYSWLRRQRKFFQWCALATLYVLAIGSVANNVYTSIYVETRTASGWRCSANYMPVIWSISGCVIAALEAVAVRTRHSPCPKSGKNNPKHIQKCWVKDGRPHRSILPEAQDTVYTEIIFGFASLMSIFQGVFGTVVLSSLLFVSFLDALPILIRYLTSAAVCNILLRLELAGLKCKLEDEGCFIGRDRTGNFQWM